MPFTIHCVTKFDITATGVKSHAKSSRIPFVDDSGKSINDLVDWNRARNQQRNWETLNQLISLRTFPDSITKPVETTHNNKKYWEFTFTVNSLDSFFDGIETLGALRSDCKDVPMLTGLTENDVKQQVLLPGSNIEFAVSENK